MIIILYLHRTNNQTTKPMTKKHKGPRLLLRWRIMRRRQQRRRQVRRIRRASVGWILLNYPRPRIFHHQSLSRWCEFAECVVLKECQVRLARKGYILGIEKWTSDIPNCKDCYFQKVLTELRASESRQRKLSR